MNINESRLVDGIVNHEANVNNILAYIKENYHIDGTYQEDSCTIKLVCNCAENALMLAQAKEYIEETLGDDMIRVVF